MSSELWNNIVTFATFLVISATAIAALIQLRHLRSGNYIAAVNELRKTTASDEMQAAFYFVETQLATKLEDPQFRNSITNAAMRTKDDQALIALINLVGNFYESMGVLIKEGLVKPAVVLEIWCLVIHDNWKKLAPLTALYRRKVGTSLWENFEYLAVLSEDWIALHPEGTYPVHHRRLHLADPWQDVDALATA